jgi:flagellum-specific ATP synthase
MKGLIQAARDIPERDIFGRDVAVRGLLVEVAGPLGAMAVGGRIDIEVGEHKTVPCEIVGFAADRALLMPFASLEGVRRGCKALVGSDHAGIRPNTKWLGRVIDAMGRPIDGKGPLPEGPLLYPFRNAPPPAHTRKRIGEPLDLGVRAINTFLTTCRGQRMGIFSGSGVGKSILLSMLARNTTEAVSVIGLVGERGREVQEFLQDDLGEA